MVERTTAAPYRSYVREIGGQRRVLLLCDSTQAAEAATRALEELGLYAERHASAAAASDGDGAAAIVVAARRRLGDAVRAAARTRHRTAVVVAGRLGEDEIAGLFRDGADDFVQARDDGAVLEALAQILRCEDV